MASSSAVASVPALVVVAVLGSAGCGGGTKDAKVSDAAMRPSSGDAYGQDDEGDPAAALDRAERDIARLFGGAAPVTTEDVPVASAAPVDPTYAQPPPVTAPKPAPAKEPGASAEALSAGDETKADPCVVACRALASMERAANHLCNLSGDAEPTCTNARERVKNAVARVSARCSCAP